MDSIKHLTTVAEFDAALVGSAIRPILIFKHSLTCGSSSLAFEEVAELRDLIEQEFLPVDIFVVSIQTARAVSNEIESRLRVRHESPQALLVCDSQVVWRATHYRVTTQAMAAALRQHCTASPATT